MVTRSLVLTGDRFLMARFNGEVLMNSRRSIRTIFSWAFVIQILASAGVIGYLSWRNSQESVEQLANQLMQRTTVRVADYIQGSTDSARIILQANANAIDNQYISVDDLPRWRSYFFDQIQIFNQNVFIYFGKANGEYVEVSQFQQLNYRIILPPPALGEALPMQQYFQLKPDGEIDQLISTMRFDIRQRPWYKQGKLSKQPVWTDIYRFQEDREVLGISLVQAHYNQQQQFDGVLGVDFILPNLGQMLRRFNPLPTGHIYIMEHDGTLIASSSAKVPYDASLKRLKATAFDDPLIQRSAALVGETTDNTGPMLPQQSPPQQSPPQQSPPQPSPPQQSGQFRLNDQTHYVRSVNLTDAYGLDWHVVVVASEADFMTQIWQQRRQSIVLIAGALVLALWSSYGIARWMTRPVMQLSLISQRIADDDFDLPIALSSSREVNQLIDSFTTMRAELQKNRQSLQQQSDRLETNVQHRRTELQQEITAHKQTQEILQTSLDQLQISQDQLVRSAKLATLGELIATVADEMDAPLTTIQRSAAQLAQLLAVEFERFPELLKSLSLADQSMYLDRLEIALQTARSGHSIPAAPQHDQILQTIANLAAAEYSLQRIEGAVIVATQVIAGLRFQTPIN
jgi:HAMP domain-containing protein